MVETITGGGVTSPRGFQAGAVACGIKPSGGLDLGLLASGSPCVAAALFTRNRVKSAPVLVSRRHLRRGLSRAVVVNSGNANAGTGEPGLRDALEMAHLAAERLGCPPHQVLVASTGVIGVPLPVGKVREGIARLSLSPRSGSEFVRAIMTTDTFPKEVAVRGELAGVPFILGGCAKGAGMLHPDLATLLAFLTTDATVERDFLKRALREAADLSFNMLTVDGDTSPSDTLAILANGKAGNPPLSQGSPGAKAFQEALNWVCLYLAKSVARDGEGATRLIEVRVDGARSQQDARRAARTVAGSSLVKAAVYGQDPNWGRVLAALGRSGARLNQDKVDIYLDKLPLMRTGKPVPFDQQQARSLLGGREVRFRVDLNLGGAGATAWGCDLTPEYVTINSAYTT